MLTGETGAGKSILLDALGLTLGSRADFALIRNDSDQAQVTASFTLARDHPANARLDEAGIAADDMLILRRRLKRDGKSNASINDVPVSLGLLREIGDMLVEIQGQFEGRGLLDVATHITLLDKAAGHADTLGKLGTGWTSWQQAKRNLAQAKRNWTRRVPRKNGCAMRWSSLMHWHRKRVRSTSDQPTRNAGQCRQNWRRSCHGR